ncbi:hypothetical protein IW262DRAFT_1290904 [Armillaria fumosa]|nr:hypothetical protein IW262DRAFT_1290904 [Armillaria fumosa]
MLPTLHLDILFGVCFSSFLAATCSRRMFRYSDLFIHHANLSLPLFTRSYRDAKSLEGRSSSEADQVGEAWFTASRRLCHGAFDFYREVYALKRMEADYHECVEAKVQVDMQRAWQKDEVLHAQPQPKVLKPKRI